MITFITLVKKLKESLPLHDIRTTFIQYMLSKLRSKKNASISELNFHYTLLGQSFYGLNKGDGVETWSTFGR